MKRAKRSKRQTRTTSERRCCASAIKRLRAGREVWAPDSPMSMYSSRMPQPRLCA